MTFTRRRFVQAASLSLIAGTALRSSLAQAISATKDETFSPENLNAFNGVSLKTFEPLVGESFSVRSGGVSQGWLTLISVSDAAAVSPASTALPMVGSVPKLAGKPLSGFALRFEGSGPKLQQGTYTLQSHNIGSISLLLVPSGPGTARTTYTAVFSFVGVPADR